MDWYDRSGGVGVLVRRLTDRCRVFRDNIEPAHDFTFFGFFFGFFDIDDLRDEGCSIDAKGISESPTWLAAGAGTGICCLVSFDEAALDGRDRLGEDSPEVVSWPKKPHFLTGNLGLVGVVGITSLSSGLELLRRRCGLFSGVVEFSRVQSNLGPALLGRASIPLSLDARCSLDSGDEVPPEMIEVRLPETECPRIVEEPSLDTRDNGRGMISTLSENPTRARFS
jgi:hypothetical protein